LPSTFLRCTYGSIVSCVVVDLVFRLTFTACTTCVSSLNLLIHSFRSLSLRESIHCGSHSPVGLLSRSATDIVGLRVSGSPLFQLVPSLFVEISACGCNSRLMFVPQKLRLSTLGLTYLSSPSTVSIEFLALRFLVRPFLSPFVLHV